MSFDEHDDPACTEYVMAGRFIRSDERKMREVKTGVDQQLPPPMIPPAEVPWQIRERVDINTRRCIADLRRLATTETAFTSLYTAMAEMYEHTVSMLDAIEDVLAESAGHSVKA